MVVRVVRVARALWRRAGVAGNDEIPQQGHENREWSNKKGAAAAAPEPT